MGANSSDEGAKYGFQGTLNAKNLQKIAFHPPMGASMLQQEGYSPLAFPRHNSCLQGMDLMSA